MAYFIQQFDSFELQFYPPIVYFLYDYVVKLIS